MKERISKVSLPFIENLGQLPDEVEFYANTFAGTVFVTDRGELVYSLPAEGGKGWVIKESFPSHGEIRGLEKTKTVVSIFKGSKENWRRNIPTYRSVSLGEITEGVELSLRAYGNQVEKLFYVKPGVDVSSIKVKVEGAKKLEVSKEGKLIVKTPLGDVEFTKPVAYQEIDGKRKYVEVAYYVEGNTYGFKVLGEYDKNKELVIDPLLASTYLGGSANEGALSVYVDQNGNVYVAGWTGSSDFPTTQGAFQTNHGGGFIDVFVSKFDTNLQNLLASTYLGGSGDEGALSVYVDQNGNVYVAGETWSSDFPTTQGAYQTNFGGGFRDAFVSKLDTNLQNLLASTYLGGSANDYALSVYVDQNGNVYVAGETTSSDFPTTQGAFQTNFGGFVDVFVSKLDTNLQNLLASTYLGGSGDEGALSVYVDQNGNVYVAGETTSSDFPTTQGAFQTNFGGGPWDAFVSKFDSNLSSNNLPVINSFTANPDTGTAPLTVTFSWSVSDADGDTLTCTLDVNNDGTADYTINDCAANTSQQHTYNTAGTYTAVLTVDDGKGGQASQSVTITTTTDSTELGGCSSAGGSYIPLLVLIAMFGLRRLIKR